MGLKGTLNIEPANARRFIGQALNFNLPQAAPTGLSIPYLDFSKYRSPRWGSREH